jgi:hypothetical protein
MSKLKQDKIPMVLTNDNLLKIAIEQGVIEPTFNWKLVREGDGMTAKSKEVLWLEFNEDKSFKAKYDEPAMGRSLIMSPFNNSFTWQTTDITEIVEERDDYIKFKTKNSVYELSRIKEENEITSK